MNPADIEAYVDAAARVIGLPVTPAQRPGVIENFARVAAVASTFLDVPLEPDVEALPTFDNERP